MLSVFGEDGDDAPSSGEPPPPLMGCRGERPPRATAESAVRRRRLPLPRESVPAAGADRGRRSRDPADRGAAAAATGLRPPACGGGRSGGTGVCPAMLLAAVEQQPGLHPEDLDRLRAVASGDDPAPRSRRRERPRSSPPAGRGGGGPGDAASRAASSASSSPNE